MPGTLTPDIEIIEPGPFTAAGQMYPPAGTTTARFGQRSAGYSAARVFHRDSVGAGRHRDVFHGPHQFVSGAQGPRGRLGCVRIAACAVVQFTGLAGQQRDHRGRAAPHARRCTSAFRRWWAFTTALGVLFVAGQCVAWRQLAAQGVFLATNPSSSFFYLLTALHGVAPARRNPGAFLRGVSAVAAVAHHASPRLPIWPPSTGTSWTGCGCSCSHFSIWDGELCTRRKPTRRLTLPGRAGSRRLRSIRRSWACGCSSFLTR